MAKMLSSEPGFCPQCGTILPRLSSKGDVKCYNCKQTFGPEGLEYHYVIHFNTPDVYSGLEKKADGEDGCVVERKCPNCRNDKMSYATLQLRSADEGQTVFYTCTKCGFKETENS
ncbi:DNA-directed RNA polymerase I subunit RPA12 isoform X2 [Zootermopsis nevadensis]|uniref:DNA-directed RNA polymerase I subunit RPA12 isoform X2 n=1 Tax=Zootermopsis nevadensis TaxID=136037 RepID=UPI000B8E9C33|nr:DNA-directed RNA polymerase I subunit RPA12 isoform X2 [Zootermopsis nevadensis]